MEDLIKALQIFMKYDKEKTKWPTHCEHDVMLVCVVKNEEDVSEEDRAKLEELGFRWSEEYYSFASFRFGSC